MENNIQEPIVEKRSSLSFIWLLPLVILAILIWTVYDSYSKKGTNITVIFNSAEGLKEGITPLKYKGFEIGKVTKIDIKDLDKVEVNILVKKDAAKYVATQGSTFWIKKPTITLTKITGLNTLISGYEIIFMPKSDLNEDFENNKLQTKFVGLNTAPEYEFVKDGYYITLIARDGQRVNSDMPIFYNSIQIGEIVSKDLVNENIYLKAYIYKKYEHLVNESSNFVLNDALDMSFGPSGLRLKLSSFYSALVGGITVSTSDFNAKKVANDEHLLLYTSDDNLEEKIPIKISFLDAQGITDKTSILYKGIEVGKIIDTTLKQNGVEANAYVFKKYKYLLTSNTKFYISEPKVSLDGVKNLNTIFTGKFVTLDYEKGKYQTTFKDKKLLEKAANDLNIELRAKELGSITNRSKIYYKNIEIGEVKDVELSSNFKDVVIKASIFNKYKDLVNSSTIFYDMSSKLVDIKNLNLSVNYSGIESLLKGSIALIGTKGKSYNKKPFYLYSSYQDANRDIKLRSQGFTIDAPFENSFKLNKDMPIFYKNQEIGFVSDVIYEEYYSKAKLFIYKKYKKLLEKHTKFYKKSPLKIDASLNGILFELDSLNSLVNGSIYLDSSNTNIPKDTKGYQVFESLDKVKDVTNTINIVFNGDIEGVQEQASKLIYKGVEIGKVVDISFNKGQIVVKVQIYKDFKDFAKRGNQFYLKKSEISLQEVKNLSSTIFAVNIGVVKSKQKGFKSSFQGFASISDIKNSNEGIIYKVVSTHTTSANIDSPIYYKNVQIGKVTNIDLSGDASKVVLNCLIYNKYTKLIRENSNFYDISGFKLNFSLFSGTKIETNTFASILKGGLMVVTPEKYGEKATQKSKFLLKEKLSDDWEKISPIIKEDKEAI